MIEDGVIFNCLMYSYRVFILLTRSYQTLGDIKLIYVKHYKYT